MNQEEIIEDIKSILHYVVEYQESNGYYDFDYGYLIELDVWECSFFDKNDNIMERFVGQTSTDIVNQLKNN